MHRAGKAPIHRRSRSRQIGLEPFEHQESGTPAAKVTSRSSACSGPKRNKAAAGDQSRLVPKMVPTATRIHANTGLGRRNADRSELLNERFTSIRPTIDRKREKKAIARASSCGIPLRIAMMKITATTAKESAPCSTLHAMRGHENSGVSGARGGGALHHAHRFQPRRRGSIRDR